MIMNPLLGMMNNPMLQNMNVIKSLMSCRNPQDVMQMMIRNDPRFSKFINDNKGLSPEKIAQKYGIDFEQVKQMMK